MSSKKLLRRPENQATYEEFLEEIKNYTEEDAQELGYPTLDLFRLELELERVVSAWHYTQEDVLLSIYGKTFYTMILKGYDLDRLPREALLPIVLMPSYPPEKVRTAILNEYKKLWSKPNL